MGSHAREGKEMKVFMDEDFLLDTEAAKILYHQYAEAMPIFDYHNHLQAQEICEHKRYETITQVWLAGDHYKWRAMRALGIEEKYITGDASDLEKFEKWAYTVERNPGNPLYAWTHLELQRYFDIKEPLKESNAADIYHRCNEKLAQPGYDAAGLLEQRKVAILCTTDEPYEDLKWFEQIRQDETIKLKVLPTYRPDGLIHIEQEVFVDQVQKMEEVYGEKIRDLSALKEAICLTLDRFEKVGCMLSDHGFEKFVYGRGEYAEEAFQKAMRHEKLTQEEQADYKGDLLRFLGEEYSRRGFAMQIHLGALRNGNQRMLQALGKDCGCDSVGGCTDPYDLAAYLDDLDEKDRLPKTILYCLNPGDNSVLSTLAVTHASAQCKGKVQFGSAWWFLDHIRGMEQQIREMMETGLFAGSVGMLTDSRSYTSFTRHEYYRRILCRVLGHLIENGEYPEDYEVLGELVKDICYRNAETYFQVKGLI